jgi:hypothetical protein
MYTHFHIQPRVSRCNACHHRVRRSATVTRRFADYLVWAALQMLLSGLAFAGAVCCGDGKMKSRAIEFCTPLASPPAEVPRVAVVLDPGDEPPLGREAQSFLLGTEYPLTTLDATTYAELRGLETVPQDTPFFDELSLVVVDNRSTTPNPPDVPAVGRAIFKGFDGLVLPIPPLGTPSASARYRGIIGGDILRRYAVRLYYGRDPECVLPWNPDQGFNTLTFIQEYSDDNKDLARDGFAVMSFALSGGGSMLMQGKELSFGATRVGVGACVEPAPFDLTALDPATNAIENLEDLNAAVPVSGLDAYLLVATGTFPIVLSNEFFSRVAAAGEQQDPPVTYPQTPRSLSLFEGRVDAQQVDLTRVALVGSVSDDQSPCLELARRRRIAWIRYWIPSEAWKGEDFLLNGAGAPVALYDGVTDTQAATPLSAYVVDSRTDLLQGLRFESSPGVPEFNGLIGHTFLKHFEMVIDYPGSRLIFRSTHYRPPDSDGTCPEPAELQNESCCETSGRCVCPPTANACAWPVTLKP